MCGAPIVLNMLANAPADVIIKPETPVEIATGGAAPPSAVIEAMEANGFRVTHLYGLTESYGPATVCAWQDDPVQSLDPGRAGGANRVSLKAARLNFWNPTSEMTIGF